MENATAQTAVSTHPTGEVSWYSLAYAAGGFGVGACCTMCMVLVITACRRRRRRRQTVVHPHARLNADSPFV